MSDQTSISEFIKEHKTTMILILVALFLVELEIFALAAMKSGRKSRLQVQDKNGVVVYETDSTSLSRFDRQNFENVYGPLNQYQVKLVTVDHPFPFRGWFAAAVGIPIGVILLLGFVVRSYMAVFHGSQTSREPLVQEGSDSNSQSRMERLSYQISRMNIFIIGFLVFLVAVAYWVVPNMLVNLGRAGLETLERHRWIVFAALAIFIALVAWIIYLRYLLAKKSVEGQIEVEKHRIQLAYHQNDTAPQQLNHDSGAKDPDIQVKWEEDQASMDKPF